METRNITISLSAELVRAARIFAAERDTTLNALLRDLLQEKLKREGRPHAAAERVLRLAESGPFSAVDPASIRREELHERR